MGVRVFVFVLFVCLFLFLSFCLGRRLFKALMKEVRASQHHAFSEGTHSNMRSQFRSFFGFCVFFNRSPLPASLDTVCGFVQFLSRSLRPTSIRNYLSGVKMLHILLGFEYPFTGSIILRLVLRGIARSHPCTPRRAPPMTPEILLAVFHVLDHQDSLECATFACGLFSFFTMSRIGSLLPKTSSTPHRHFLTRSRVTACDAGIILTFLHTKTIQFGQRLLHLPLLRSDSPLCPVAAFAHASALMGDPSPIPAFTYRKQDGTIAPLTAAVFISTFRSLLTRMGRADSSSFRGHSFRRGGASYAFNSGVPGEIVQVCGDWKSDAYKSSMSSRIAIAKRLVSSLPPF